MSTAFTFEQIAGPRSLAEVEGAYGVRVLGNSMEPAYKPGETVFVHPSASLVPGCDVILRQSDPDRSAVIHTLVRETESEWHVHQYNPDADMMLSKSEWPICEKIVGKYNLV